MATYSHRTVLDGAEGVWADGSLVAVWHGGRTLNLYRDTGDGWASASTHQYQVQPTREEVRSDPQRELGLRPPEDDEEVSA